MDHQSIVEQSPAPAMEGDVSARSASRIFPPNVSGGIRASGHQAKPPKSWPRFLGEDGGRSLAAMAYRDLDAALQLLAERAQYITGASGAMIALRRDDRDDMLCRASAGSSAPELGALLSMEYGFSGESVRTRQPLRCDDAESDPRVNREGCRQLGIASVVVMPILNNEQVLGVFELFSGKPRAFEERDLSALQRLSEMVATAVKYAVAAQAVPAAPDDPVLEESVPPGEIKPQVETVATHTTSVAVDLASVPPAQDLQLPELNQTKPEQAEAFSAALRAEPQLAEVKPAEPTPKKSLFWSAATQSRGDAGHAAESADSTALPAVLRNLHKCQACGFPVSQGRKYCVECEEKQWRGEPSPKPTATVVKQVQPQPPANTGKGNSPGKAVPSRSIGTNKDLQHLPPKPEAASAANNAALFQSASVNSQSWLAANKYILGVMVLVALTIAAIALLH